MLARVSSSSTTTTIAVVGFSSAYIRQYRHQYPSTDSNVLSLSPSPNLVQPQGQSFLPVPVYFLSHNIVPEIYCSIYQIKGGMTGNNTY